jgi:hypothetical protein
MSFTYGVTVSPSNWSDEERRLIRDLLLVRTALVPDTGGRAPAPAVEGCDWSAMHQRRLPASLLRERL